MSDDGEPQGIDEWVAVLALGALLAPLTPEQRQRLLDELGKRLEDEPPGGEAPG